MLYEDVCIIQLKFANAAAITVTLLIVFGMILSSTLVNVYGQAIKSPFPQFPMVLGTFHAFPPRCKC